MSDTLTEAEMLRYELAEAEEKACKYRETLLSIQALQMREVDPWTTCDDIAEVVKAALE